MLEKLLGFFLKPNEESGKNKRSNTLMYLSIIAMVGVLLMLLSNMGNPNISIPDTNSSEEVATTLGTSRTSTLTYHERLEGDLKRILSYINGVGKVEVQITFEQGSEFVFGFDTSYSRSNTEERDTSGGIRNIDDSSGSQNIVIVRDRNGEERPVIQTERYPVIKGVLVVAEGAEDPKVNAELTRAVNTVLGVPLHKICVLPYKR